MVAPTISDEDFINLWRSEGPTALARQLNISVRGVFNRRRNVEVRNNIRLVTPNPNKERDAPVYQPHPERATFNIHDGIVLVGSDLHAWPGPKPVAFRAFVQFCRSLRPTAVIMNGDVIRRIRQYQDVIAHYHTAGNP